MNNMIDIYLPLTCSEQESVFWNHVSSQLDIELNIHPQSDCDIRIISFAEKTIKIPYNHLKGDENLVVYNAIVDTEIIPCLIIKNEYQNEGILFLDRLVVFQFDIISPLISVMNLNEEKRELRRDQFGLVLGKNSSRFADNALFEPFFENFCYLLKEYLGVTKRTCYPEGKEWALAISCDIDALDTDHLAGVISFFKKYSVEKPTFMVFSGFNVRNKNDPKYDIFDPDVQNRLKPLIENDVEIGLHSSYLAHDKLSLLIDQKNRLEDFFQRPIIGHRAHFYRFSYPRSWSWQYRAGFLYDASLGFPDVPGLRNGCSLPLQFFDPSSGFVPFFILPTGILDQHFFWPEKVPENEFILFIDAIIERFKKVGGVLVVDYHTYTYQESYQDQKWWDRLEYILQKSKINNAYIAGIGKVMSNRIPKIFDIGIF